MKKARVLIHGTPGSTVVVEHGATAGATFGKDIRTEDGQVLSLQALIAMAVGAMPSPPSVSATDWSLIADIPENVLQVADLATNGLVTRLAGGTWTTRTVEGVAGETTSANENGESGNPTIGLWTVGNTAVGTLLSVTVDLKGRVVGYRNTTTADLTPLLDASYQPLIAFAANQFGARGSVGAYGAKPITDSALLAVGGAGATSTFLRGDSVLGSDLVNTAGGMMYGALAFGGAGGLICTRTNGTVGLPTAVVNNNNLNIMGARGYDGTITTTTDRAALIAYATGNWTNTSHPTGYRIDLTASGATASATIVRVLTTAFRPAVDNAITSAASGFRWSEVWAAIGAINTSDARLKTPVRPFTDNELAAALALAEEVGLYQFLASIEVKGDFARDHCGMTVQRAIEVMQAHGLEPFNYGFICYDQWPEEPDTYNEQGELVCAATPAGELYSFRPDQLDRFITKGVRENQKRIEARLNALESKP